MCNSNPPAGQAASPDVVPSPDLADWTVGIASAVAKDRHLSFLARGIYLAIQGGAPLVSNDRESRGDIVEGLAELGRLGLIRPRRR